ncbi:hypothetical protein LZ31DRAFT_567923 [Colletotrichum somersetense]|nr:hypothetical protein LZ31DRAFT_567923 [Colletotrichum somersetense]
MRTSTFALAVVSAVALLSSKAVAADEKTGKPGWKAENRRVAAAIKPGHDARSLQDVGGFVSYDYGYSYPAPPPPTTYAEFSSSSSTVTSLVSSSNVSSVASVTGTSAVSDSASFSSAVSASATVTPSDSATTSPPISATATRSASTAISESLNYTTSFEAGPSTSSSDDDSGTLASITDTDVPYIPSTGPPDGTISSGSTTSSLIHSTGTTIPTPSTSSDNGTGLTTSSSAATSSILLPIAGSKCFKHATIFHELVNHGAYFNQLLGPPLELHHNLNDGLECVRRTIFHFDKYPGIFHDVFKDHAFTDNCAVSVAERNCHCHKRRDNICIDDIWNRACHLIYH